MPVRAPNSIAIADRHALFHTGGPDVGGGELDGVAGTGGRAMARYQGEDDVLGADARLRRAVEVDPHGAGSPCDRRLGRHHMRGLGGADSEGERAQRAMRAGVAVGAHDGEAGLRQAEFRPDDVDDALAARFRDRNR
jgi:hypothetical protein